jgi:hypothetical protein
MGRHLPSYSINCLYYESSVSIILNQRTSAGTLFWEQSTTLFCKIIESLKVEKSTIASA